MSTATMTRDDFEIAREAAVCEIDAVARDNGHDPHAWTVDDVAAAHTCCRKCGATAAVRVRVGGTWKAGHLRFTTCPA